MDNIEKLLKYVKCCVNGKCSECLLVTAENDCREELDDLVHVIVKEAHTEGAEEAWELSRKIVLSENNGGISTEIISKIFGTIIFPDILNNPFEEVNAKYEEYMEKNSLKVGDVVTLNDGVRAIVLREADEEECYIIFPDGTCGEYKVGNLERTGEHIDLSDIFALLSKEGE